MLPWRALPVGAPVDAAGLVPAPEGLCSATNARVDDDTAPRAPAGRTVTLVSAPSNLGLRPPEPTTVPGTAKAPEALREAGLHQALAARGARDGGAVLPGRYIDDGHPGAWRLRNQDGIVDHSRRLADRLAGVLDAGGVPAVLGGDCSILVGVGVTLARRGRYGLVHIDGHTDFRHPGNSPVCLSLAGEDLAAAVGKHWPTVADIDGLAPYFRPGDTVHIGCRDDDEQLDEAVSTLGAVVPARSVRRDGPDQAVAAALDIVAAAPLDGFWIHVDVDVLDPQHMPAVDSPDPGGLTPDELGRLLAGLAPSAAGVHVTVFDPDLDPTGSYAALLVSLLVDALPHLGAADP
jgi:arginase